MRIRFVPTVVWLCAAALVPAEVSAQRIGSNSPPPASVRRPYRGLFGNPGDPNAPQSLTLSASLFGAYDDNVTADIAGTNRIDPRLQRSGEYFGLNAGLNYALSKSTNRVSIGLASGAAANGYYVDGDRSVVPHAHVSANIGFLVTPRTTLSLTEQVIYSRYYRFQLFPSPLGPDDDGALVGDPDMELYRRTAFRYLLGGGISHRLSPRSSLNAAYHIGYVDFRDDLYRDWKNQTASIDYTRQVTAYAGMHLGYGYRVSESTATTSRPREIHDINVGMSYGRALSFSRRTSLQFSTGSAIVVSENLAVADSDPRTRFRLIGNAVLAHEMGRTWTANVAYNRGLIFRDGFDEPFAVDALSGGLAGFASRRLYLSLLVRRSFASLDQPGRNRHNAFAASADARYALSRFVALYVRYINYQYEFGEDIPLEPGLARTLDRQGVRVGITTSLPLIR